MSDVAPFAGAWIEIPSTGNWVMKLSSLPSRERGLKYCINVALVRCGVAPFAGAWIEII